MYQKSLLKEYIKNTEKFEKARYIRNVASNKEGFVQEINAEDIGKLSGKLGAGRKNKNDKIDLSVGLVLNKKIGDFVRKGDKLATIYANSEKLAEEAEKDLLKIYVLGKEKTTEKTILDIIK